VAETDKRRRFFVSREEEALGPPGGQAGAAPTFTAGQRLALPPAEAHHAAHVLRLRPGDAIALFDGAGSAALARVAEVRRGAVTALVEEAGPPLARPAPIVHLAFAVPKGGRLDWLLEKATELGAASLRPIVFERSVAGGALSLAQRRRWRSRCVSAAKQAGLDFLPTIEDPMPLADYLAAPRDGLGLVGDLSADARPFSAAVSGQAGAPRTYNIAVGPEGGLTAGEREALRRAGFVPVRLGRTVLRVETAAVALLSGILALQG